MSGSGPFAAGAGRAERDKVVSADDAVRLVRDGDAVVVEGFMGQAFPEDLVLALEHHFLTTGAPRDLTLVFTVAVGDRTGRGLDHLAHDGLVSRAIGGHWGLSPALSAMAVDGRIAAHNLPQGVISQLFRDTAAGKPGLVTPVGLGTFVDPRHGGGKVNPATTEDLVEVVELAGREVLFYRALPAQVALLRGTTADPSGNVTMEREALTLQARAVATAVHNAGGLVVVQVERLAAQGALSPRDVEIPGVLVDCVVLAEPEHHWQTFGTPYSPAYSGEVRRVPLTSMPAPLLDERKVVARRAAMELRPGSVINLGVGMPEGIAAVAHEEGVLDTLTLTAEPGVIGGLPAAGLDFGAATNAHAILDQPAQFDFYDGGGLDAAFLGMAQADREGNVNVSRFGTRLAGAGGFVNISQNARRVVFVGTLTAPSRCRVVDGGLEVLPGEVTGKLREAVEQRTFSGSVALSQGQPVLYVTERCVLRLGPGGLELVEVAPGLDLERDVLAHIGFDPVVDGEPALMDPRLFRTAPMELATDLLDVPLDERFAYDADRDLFFMDFSGLSVTTSEGVAALREHTDRLLTEIGRPVDAVVNYDDFHLSADQHDAYLAAVEAVASRHYRSVTRYSTSSFMRLKLVHGLEDRGLAPHVLAGPQDARRPG